MKRERYMPDYPSKVRWAKEHFLMVSIKFHRTNDAEVVSFLESKGADRTKFIKIALREYLENHKNEIKK